MLLEPPYNINESFPDHDILRWRQMKSVSLPLIYHLANESSDMPVVCLYF